MSASSKQIKLIQDLQSLGAPIPEHPVFDRPDDSMFHSVVAANKYIKQHYHLLLVKANGKKTLDEIASRVSAQDWCGIPNH